MYFKKAAFKKVVEEAKGDRNEESILGPQPWASLAWRLNGNEEEGGGVDAGLQASEQDKKKVAIVFPTQGTWAEGGVFDSKEIQPQ